MGSATTPIVRWHGFDGAAPEPRAGRAAEFTWTERGTHHGRATMRERLACETAASHFFVTVTIRPVAAAAAPRGAS